MLMDGSGLLSLITKVSLWEVRLEFEKTQGLATFHLFEVSKTHL